MKVLRWRSTRKQRRDSITIPVKCEVPCNFQTRWWLSLSIHTVDPPWAFAARQISVTNLLASGTLRVLPTTKENFWICLQILLRQFSNFTAHRVFFSVRTIFGRSLPMPRRRFPILFRSSAFSEHRLQSRRCEPQKKSGTNDPFQPQYWHIASSIRPWSCTVFSQRSGRRCSIQSMICE